MQQHTNKNFEMKKAHIMRSKKAIEELFRQSSSSFLYPFKAVYALEPAPEERTAQVLFVVPKKQFKKAVQRNRIRRIVKEAYRLNQAQSLLPVNLSLALIYVGKKEETLDFCMSRIKKICSDITKNIANLPS